MRRALITAVAGVLFIGGCDTGRAARICATDSGAQACLVAKSTGQYKLEATGFKPDSELQLTQAGLPPGGGDPPPLRLRLGADGTYADGRGSAGVIVPPGAAPVTVTISGTAGSGVPVVLSLVTTK